MSVVKALSRFTVSQSPATPRRVWSFMLLVAAILPAVVMADDSEALIIADPYFRETLPGQDRTAGFFVASNTGNQNCSLVAAAAPGIDRLEIHEHSHEGGMMRMRQVAALSVAAGDTLVLSPGGYHLMGFGVSPPLVAGETVTVSLDFGECGSKTVPFAVIDPRR